VRATGHGGVKASGGIRSAESAAEYVALADEVMGAGWAAPERFRLGASALVDDLLGRLREAATA
jgi:deoxyribose-phosphate aldolase